MASLPGRPAATVAPTSGVELMDDERRVPGQVERAAATGAFAGGGTLFTEPVLVVNQKTKIIELTNEYAVFDAAGKQLGAVRQTGQTTLKKALRPVSSIDQFMTPYARGHRRLGRNAAHAHPTEEGLQVDDRRGSARRL